MAEPSPLSCWALPASRRARRLVFALPADLGASLVPRCRRARTGRLGLSPDHTA